MPSSNVGDSEPRIEKREHGLRQRRDLVVGGDGSNSAMAEREGVLQVLDDFGFGLQLGGTVGVLLKGLHIDVLAHERAEKKVIGEADVLHLLGESAHTLELAVGRRKRVFVFWHGLRGGNDLPFDNAIKRVEHGRNRRGLLSLLGRGATLRVDGRGCGGAQNDEKRGEVFHWVSLYFFCLGRARRNLTLLWQGKSKRPGNRMRWGG